METANHQPGYVSLNNNTLEERGLANTTHVVLTQSTTSTLAKAVPPRQDVQKKQACHKYRSKDNRKYNLLVVAFIEIVDKISLIQTENLRRSFKVGMILDLRRNINLFQCRDRLYMSDSDVQSPPPH